MPFDPSKWLEVLKTAITTAGIYKFALAAVCVLYWLAARNQWIPSADPWELRAAALGFILFASLWLATVISSIFSIFSPRYWIVHWIKNHNEKKWVRKYIPYMTPKEREIIGYLLSKNQKMLLTSIDGGEANTLISRGIIVQAVRPGQAYNQLNVPMAIPDHIWDVLVQHKDEFRYIAPRHKPDSLPWRRPWMAD